MPGTPEPPAKLTLHKPPALWLAPGGDRPRHPVGSGITHMKGIYASWCRWWWGVCVSGGRGRELLFQSSRSTQACSGRTSALGRNSPGSSKTTEKCLRSNMCSLPLSRGAAGGEDSLVPLLPTGRRKGTCHCLQHAAPPPRSGLRNWETGTRWRKARLGGVCPEPQPRGLGCALQTLVPGGQSGPLQGPGDFLTVSPPDPNPCGAGTETKNAFFWGGP